MPTLLLVILADLGMVIIYLVYFLYVNLMIGESIQEPIFMFVPISLCFHLTRSHKVQLS